MTDLLYKMVYEGTQLVAMRLHIEKCKECRDKFYEVLKCTQKENC